MADFLTRIAERTLGMVPVVHPTIGSKYAPDSMVADIQTGPTAFDSAPDLGVTEESFGDWEQTPIQVPPAPEPRVSQPFVPQRGQPPEPRVSQPLVPQREQSSIVPRQQNEPGSLALTEVHPLQNVPEADHLSPPASQKLSTSKEKSPSNKGQFHEGVPPESYPVQNVTEKGHFSPPASQKLSTSKEKSPSDTPQVQEVVPPPEQHSRTSPSSMPDFPIQRMALHPTQEPLLQAGTKSEALPSDSQSVSKQDSSASFTSPSPSLHPEQSRPSAKGPRSLRGEPTQSGQVHHQRIQQTSRQNDVQFIAPSSAGDSPYERDQSGPYTGGNEENSMHERSYNADFIPESSIPITSSSTTSPEAATYSGSSPVIRRKSPEGKQTDTALSGVLVPSISTEQTSPVIRRKSPEGKQTDIALSGVLVPDVSAQQTSRNAGAPHIVPPRSAQQFIASAPNVTNPIASAQNEPNLVVPAPNVPNLVASTSDTPDLVTSAPNMTNLAVPIANTHNLVAPTVPYLRSTMHTERTGSTFDHLTDHVPMTAQPTTRTERTGLTSTEKPSAAPLQEADSAPTIRVTIGRIDVQAVASTPPASPLPPRPNSSRPALSLDDYLKQRNGGQR